MKGGPRRDHARIGILVCVLSVSLACATPGPVGADGRLWHASGAFGVPDLALGGWERVDVSDADFAFRDADGVTIAVRSRCGIEDPLSLEWRARELYLGISAERRSQRELEVNGFPAYEIVADVDEFEVRTVVVWAGGCVVDLAQARRRSAAPDERFESFVAGFRAVE